LIKENYKLLCKSADNILRNSQSYYKTSIPCLHILKTHPEIFKKYQNKTEKKKTKKNNLIRKRNFFRFHSGDIKNFNNNECFDLIVVSHLINIDHLTKDEDFYFPEVNSLAKQKKLKTVYVLINHTRERFETIQKFIGLSKTARLVLSGRVGILEEIKHLFNVLKEILAIRLFSPYAKEFMLASNNKTLNFYSAIDALGPLRIARKLEHLIASFKPSIVMSTFEGHSWERLVFAKSFLSKENILRVGYQHSIVNSSHAVFRPLGKIYDPDLILTSGSITFAEFEKSYYSIGTRVQIFGSNKNFNYAKVKHSKQKGFLVIPEGLLGECNKLFRFSLDCAFNYHNLNFVWRLHPKMSFEELLENLKLDKAMLPNNIVLSDCNLKEDINRSSHVLYRGSSTVINSIYNGLIPVYLDDKTGINIDFFKDICSSHHVDCKSDLLKISKSNSFLYQRKFIDYISSYFSPIDYSIEFSSKAKQQK